MPNYTNPYQLQDAKTLQELIGQLAKSYGQGSAQQHDAQMPSIQADVARDQQEHNIQRGMELKDQLNAGGKGESYNVALSPQGGVSFAQNEKDPFAVQFGKAMQGANITGYSVANPKVIPSAKDAEEVKGATQGYKSMNQGAKRLDDLLQKASPMDRMGSVNVPLVGPVGTQTGKEMDAQIGDLLMQAKNLEKLGALQAPEVKLMERIQGSMTGLSSLFQGKDEVRQRLSDLIIRAKSRVEETAKARGYSPHQGFLDDNLSANRPNPNPQAAPSSQDPEMQEYLMLRKKHKGM